MAKVTRPAVQGLCQRLALGGFALLAVAMVSGCGAEPDKAPATNPNATAVPGGMNKDDYAKQMQEKASQMGGGGGAPGMAPGGGRPGGPPGGPPPGPPPGAPPK